MAFQAPENEEWLILALLSLLLDRTSGDRASYRFRESLYKTRFESKELDRLLFQYEGDSFRRTRNLERRLHDYFRSKEYWNPDLDRSLRILFDEPYEESPRTTKRLDHLEDYVSSLSRTDNQGVSRLEVAFNDISSKVNELESRLNESILTTSDQLNLMEWLSSNEVPLSKAQINRSVPVRIYVADPVPNPEKLENITSQLNRFLNEFGLIQSDDYPPEEGSWWKRFYYKTINLLTHQEVLDKARDAEKALKLKHLDIPEAQANNVQADATSKLISSLEGTDAACIQAGSLLLIKAKKSNGESAIFSKTLCATELKAIEENQSILSRPNDILGWLEKVESQPLIDPNV